MKPLARAADVAMSRSMTSTRATRFLWTAAGCPTPTETDGAPIRERDMGGARCASCGEPARYRLGDAISGNFSTVKNANRAWPHGGDALCAACLWCCKAIALKSACFFARVADEHGAGGFWFVPLRPLPGHPETRPDALAALCAPPPPPFVAGLPLFGIDHGGEANVHRVAWGGVVPPDPLIKLQAKHTALYCRVSYSAERYHLQVDDAGDVTVDVALWRRLRAHVEAALVELRAAGVGANAAREALTTLRAPVGAPLALAAPSAWRERVEPIRPHVGAPWWPLFLNLVPMPDLTPRAKPAPAPPPVPVPVVAPAPAASPKTEQLALF